jgi:arylformamidase
MTEKKTMGSIIDIAPAISASLAVWPGDTPPRREILLELERGDNITLSTLHATVHLGAHADGHNHIGKGHPGIDARPLEDYLGLCQVIRVSVPRRGIIRPADLGTAVCEKRVLLATDTFPDPDCFNDDFAALAPELVDHLHHRGVRLIGIDTPSVDPFDSKVLPAHDRFLACDMAILEGLRLAGVAEGRYELIALPLRLVGFDASPVRAILRTLS